MEATAYWTTGPRCGELRREPIAPPEPGQVLVRSLASGVSRGTELLIHRHAVPESVRSSLRAPFQVGELPGPVKFGYLNVGIVEAGPAELVGRRVFCLHPHQDRYTVAATAVVPVPDNVPTLRAVLAGTVETAVNALWDAGPRLGDRIAVVGAGLVGLSVAALLTRFPLSRLEVVDVDPARRRLGETLGVKAVGPEAAAGECDLVFHTSAAEQGLATALRLLGLEGEVIELSWYGIETPRVPLGGEFHARRLIVRASQVGRVSPSRSARRSFADRLALALELLADPGFDALLGDPVPFAQLPKLIADLDAGRVVAPCPVVFYPEAEEPPCSS